MIVTQIYPDEYAIAYPFIKEAMELARARGLAGISPAMLKGFSSVKVLVQALRRSSPKPTRERIQSALDRQNAPI